MSKRELIQRIIERNHSARPEFLEAFTENELGDYLRQLEHLADRIVAVRTRKTAARSN